MRCLVDNMVPRSVTYLLRDGGIDSVEVREVLGQSAPDDAVAAYAAAFGYVLVTHDRALARRALASGLPHVWLRTREPQDRHRLAEVLEEVGKVIDAGALRVTVTRRTLRIHPPTE